MLTTHVDTKEKPYSCPCGRSFSRKDLLTRHERLSHSFNGDRGHTQGWSTRADELGPFQLRYPLESTPSTSRLTGSAPVGLPQAPLQHHQQDLELTDLALPSALPTADPMLLSPIDGLFASHGDPMLDFNRFLGLAELDINWNAYPADSMPVLEGIQSQNAPDQQFTPDSTDFSSRIPDDSAGNGK